MAAGISKASAEHNRTEAWSVDEHQYPANASNEEQFRFLLRYAILAPSVHNTQPWVFEVTDSDVRVFANIAAWLEVADRDKRDQYVSIGCAIENLLVAADYFGWQAAVNYCPEPNNVAVAATIELTKAPAAASSSDQQVFKAIVRRHTDHSSYDPEPVAPHLLRELTQAASETGLICKFLTDVTLLPRIADLLVKADAAQFSNSNYIAELEHWMAQGVYGTAWLLKKLQRMAIKVLQAGGEVGPNYWIILKDAPAVGVICSADDDAVSRIKAGQAFERLFLKATALGLSLEAMSHVLQVAKTRTQIAEVFDLPASHPQILFRIGFKAFDQSRTVRQPVESVILTTRPPLSTPPEFAVAHDRKP